MPRKRYTPEQIIRKLREAEVELAKGQTTGDVVRKLGITEQTYYRWSKEYGGLRHDQAARLKERQAQTTMGIRVFRELLNRATIGSNGFVPLLIPGRAVPGIHCLVVDCPVSGHTLLVQCLSIPVQHP